MSKRDNVLNYMKPKKGVFVFTKKQPDGSVVEVERKECRTFSGEVEIRLVDTGLPLASSEDEIDVTPRDKKNKNF